MKTPTEAVPKFKAQPRVAVVVLNWRRPQDTILCVTSVMKLDYSNLDIVICDNDSGDGSIDTISSGLAAFLPEVIEMRRSKGFLGFEYREVAPDIRNVENEAGTRRLWLTQTGRNGGYAFGNNVGIRLAMLSKDIEYIWILNNDTIVDETSLKFLVAQMASDPAIGICGAKVLYSGRDMKVQTLGGGRFLPFRARCEQIGEGLPATEASAPENVEAVLSYVNGAAALVRRELVEQIGYMDEGYFLYWEELDWATRALASGKFRLGYCPDALVYHQVGASSGTSDHGIPSLSSTYWMTRSKFRYLRLHRPWLLAIAFPLLLKAVIREGLAQRWTRAQMMIRGAFSLPVKF
ncbi:glycosyltransferase family 2 protein [Sphingobium sp. SCG-1]|uniref:glycosyltransferase family 2 protein n=1 Tax=Sphingobium sp. SCG-1 TaxID=2072936 RepID=UPI001670EF3C|nr:glycosyltransferase family 2 protein [Sphingobium sp. SCG-1]